MNVTCPYCSTSYRLPSHLLGPGGARVRCPRCQGQFSVPPPAVGAEAAPSEAGAGAALGRGAVEPRSAAGVATGGDGGTRAEAPARGASAAAGEQGEGAGHRDRETEGDDRLVEAYAVATELVERLAQEGGDALASAISRGQLFAKFGPRIAAAFDEYRSRAGRQVGEGPFREALRERLGVDLEA